MRRWFVVAVTIIVVVAALGFLAYTGGLIPLTPTAARVSKILEAGDVEAMRRLLDRGFDLNTSFIEPPPDDIAWTPLRWATMNGDAAMVRLLVESGIDLERVDVQGQTPITSAICCGTLEIVEFLLDAGADPNARDQYTTPLWEAAGLRWGNGAAIVELLLDRNADASFTSNRGVTVIHRAAGVPLSIELIQKLIDRGADPLRATDFGETALHEITRGHEISIPHLRFFLSLGVSVNQATEYGDTALHGAARRSAEATLMLLEAGADPSLADDRGWNALHFAVASGEADAVAILLKTGLDPEAKVSNGHANILDLAHGDVSSMTGRPEDWRRKIELIKSALEAAEEPDDGYAPPVGATHDR